MKLLTIRNNPEKYGSEGHVLRVAVGLAKRNWEVHAAFPHTPGMRDMVDACRSHNVCLHQFGELQSASKVVLDSPLKRLIATWRLVYKVKPDVVQITLGWPTEALSYVVACALMHVPLVLVFQLAPEVVPLPLYRKAVYHWARRRRQSWFAVSAQNLEMLRQTFGVESDDVRILYNGADTDSPLASASDAEIASIRRSVREELNLPPESRILLTTGRLSRQKGYYELLEAIPSILAGGRARHSHLKFLWAGTGEEMDALKDLVNKAGLQNDVLFLGYRSDIPRLLTASDLFIFPTRAEGGCSSSIREAMVHSTPIVSTFAGGIPEVIETGRQGLLVRHSEPGVFAEAVHWALDHPKEMLQMAAAAKVRIQDFSTDRMITDYAAAFEETVTVQTLTSKTKT